MPRAIDLTLEVLKADDIFPIPDRKSRMKWNGPWWHMAALYEMGESVRIPESAVIKALELLKNGAWPRFVIAREDAPRRDSDRAKMDCCHCELGVFYMILASRGCDVDAELPWMRDWFLRHQLPDGGLNCSPVAYRGSGKSSIVSTLPPLEAVLFFTNRKYTDAEENFLAEGARYLIEHRLVCSKIDGRVINRAWLKPLFPRFFEYDILRGMYFLVAWSRRTGRPPPDEVIKDGLDRLRCHIGPSGVVIGRHVNDKNGGWHGSTFPLLESVGAVGTVSPYLTKQLNTVLRAVHKKL
jgi:hypothetical protein